MALDIGDARVGIAVCDPGESVASPVAVVPAPEVLANARTFRALIEDWEPDLLLCGLPKSLSGEEGAQAAHIREFAMTVSGHTGIPVEFVDERLSSREAKSALRDMGYDEKRMRGKVDMVAASLFLQSYLDGRNAKGA